MDGRALEEYQEKLIRLDNRSKERLEEAKQKEKRETWQAKTPLVYSMFLNDKEENVKVIRPETGNGCWRLYNAQAKVLEHGLIEDGVFDQLGLKPEIGEKLHLRYNEAGRIWLIALPGNSLRSNYDGYVFLWLACVSGQLENNGNLVATDVELDYNMINFGVGYLTNRMIQGRLFINAAESVAENTGHPLGTVEDVLYSLLPGVHNEGLDGLTLQVKSNLAWQGDEGVMINIDGITQEDY